MANEACAACQNEQSVQHTRINKVIDLLILESSTATEHIDEACCNATIYIQDQTCFLGCGNILHTQCKFQHLGIAEVLQGIVLHKLHTHVWVCLALDAVANAHDEDVILLRITNKSFGCYTRICCFGEHLSSIVQCTSKTWPDAQQARAQRRNQVLACACCHDGVVRTRHSWTMVSADDEAHLDEFQAVVRELAAEPEQRDRSTNSQAFFDDFADGHP
mmetsp:Transcript_71856/g.124637  ORF Transcript_71856/g.124637 Transcript_71856/m.124637 type:complete len:218 (-) Transcript_71856:681-1334(-)